MAIVRHSMSEILSSMKMYKTRLDSTIQRNVFRSNQERMVALKKKTDTKINHRDPEDVKKEIVERHASYLSLVENLRKLNIIKNGVNDIVTVNVAGREMTIAQVLSMSNNTIKLYQEQYINKLKSDYSDAIDLLNSYNEKVFAQDKIDNWISVFLGTTTAGLNEIQKNDPSRVQDAIDKYHEQNDMEIIDPLNILEEIKSLEEYYDALYNNISFTLSAMNARIIVEYDLDSKDPNFWKIVNLDEINSIKRMIANDYSEELVECDN